MWDLKPCIKPSGCKNKNKFTKKNKNEFQKTLEAGHTAGEREGCWPVCVMLAH